MHRSAVLLCAAALTVSGLASSAPAVAAPGGAASAASDASAAPSGPTAPADELLVGYVPGATPAAQQRARSRSGAARVERVVPSGADRAEVELVRLPPGASRAAAVRELESDPAVRYAEPNWTYTHQATASEPSFADGSLWGMYGDGSTPANAFGSQAAEAWAAGHVGSPAVHIGVIDEGIQFDHPDLAGQVWVNPFDAPNGKDDDGNGYVDDVRGWDFANGDSTVYDGGTRGSLDDHGTHVAGTIGAKADGKGVVGVDHAVTMISGKFLGRRGGSTADAVRAVDYFTDLKTRHGLNVVATNNSWGGGGFSQTLLDAIVRGAKAQILFVAAAGNNGSDNDATPSYPSSYDTTTGAGYDSVIAVAAIDRTGARPSFSQYGRASVDLAAPGVGILSTTAYSTHSSYDGTSMATPHVTGGAALYAATRAGATAAAVKAAILAGTVPTASLTGTTVTGGRLDVSGF